MTTLEHMVVPIEWKSMADCENLPPEWKAEAEDPNTLIGYASTFDNVDLGGDVVVKGAFLKTIERIKAEGIPLLADHMPSTASVLGTINDAMEDSVGLVIKAKISKAPSAQDTAVKLREGHLDKMSIGYETMDDAYEEREGMKVRLLKEIKLWETSVVVFPMNPKATITRVKSVLDALAPEDRKAVLEEITDLSAMEPKEEPMAAPPVVVEAKTETDDTTDAGDEPVEAPDEGASGYDRYASRAILAGRPVEDVDPVRRATLATRLALAESQLPPPDPED